MGGAGAFGRLVVGRLSVWRKTWKLSLVVHMTACVAVVVVGSFASRWLTPMPEMPKMPIGFQHRSGRNFSKRGGQTAPAATPAESAPDDLPPSDGAPPDDPFPPDKAGMPNAGGHNRYGSHGFGPGGFGARAPVVRRTYGRAGIWDGRNRFSAGSHAGADLLAHCQRDGRAGPLSAFAAEGSPAAELSASLAKANLQALQHQLQPHFLFNALNAIAALIHTNPNAADDMIANLSDLLRMSLDLALQPETTLRREMEILSCYLDIERARFQDRLEVSVNVDPEALDAWMPALLLQPLVENAVRHGLEGKAKRTPIEIRARIEGEDLRLTVSDRGPGLVSLPDGTIKVGIGVSNTRARLRELYGDRGVLRVENDPAGGCIATAILPLHMQPISDRDVVGRV